MSKSLSEYKRFIGKSLPTLSDHEKKLARLILDNFPKVEAAGTAGGRRGKLIAQLIAAAGDSAPSCNDLQSKRGRPAIQPILGQE